MIDFTHSRIKKGESQGNKCHAFKMNAHHVPLRQIVAEIRPEMD